MALRKGAATVLQRFRTTSRWHAQRGITMDDDGSIANHMQTKVTVLNKEDESGVFIDSYSSVGFRLNTGVKIIGPIVVFPKTILHWNVNSVADINEDSLSLFTMMDPKADILLLGVGEKSNLTKVPRGIIRYLREKRMNMEILSTDMALATFNFLNAEKRFVAGAFLPPGYMERKPRSRDGTLDMSKEEQQQIYQENESVNREEQMMKHESMLELRKLTGHTKKDKRK